MTPAAVADGEPAGNTDSDPRSRCRDHSVTSQHPGTGGHIRDDADSGDTHPGPDNCTGAPDTGANVSPDSHGGDPSTD